MMRFFPQVHSCRFLRLSLLATAQLSVGQDLFLADGHAKGFHGLQASVVNHSAGSVALGAAVGSDETVFTISPASQPDLCLDFAKGHGGTRLQVWECNGKESQFFYFDPNSYKITWGADRNLCIDAGGNPAKAGTWLQMFPCKGYPQQKWSFDSKYGTIYLASSSTDASMCMDIVNGAIELGTPVQIWNCGNGLPQQAFRLQHGISIRPYWGLEFCLDLVGGPTHKPNNGDKVQLWNCNGYSNQKWAFISYTIRPINDFSKCIDGGQAMKGATPLMIWDCNGAKQQFFGYDVSNAKTIYLSNSADANLCLDVAGGKMSAGTTIQTWQCINCWNQQWQAYGPSAQFAQALTVPPLNDSTSTPSDGRGFLAPRQNNSLSVPGKNSWSNCPPRGHKPFSPAPGPPAHVNGHCATGSNYGFPVFHQQSDLQNSPWGKYYTYVYGELPTTGYPICPYMLFLLYRPLLGRAGVTLPSGVDSKCPTQAGTTFAKMSGFPSTDWAWIYSPMLGRPVGDYVPANTWVEVMHTAYIMDGMATWFYYTPGSGVYAWTGTTFAYKDHPDGVSDLLNGAKCSDPAGQIGNNECEDNFAAMYDAAIKKGANTLQFKKHSDMQCDVNNNNDQRNMAIEIVDLGGPGITTCSGKSGKTRFRAGWQAKYECVCDNARTAINCEGFGLTR